MATQVFRKNTTATLIVDTNSFTTSDSPFYTFKFIGSQKPPVVEITLENVSAYPSKYGYFTFIEGTDATMNFIGLGKYYVYDSNDVLVDSGQVVVLREDEVVEYTYPNTDENNYSYS